MVSTAPQNPQAHGSKLLVGCSLCSPAFSHNHCHTKLALGKGVRVNLSVQVSLNQPSWGWQDGKEIRQIDNFFRIILKYYLV